MKSLKFKIVFPIAKSILVEKSIVNMIIDNDIIEEDAIISRKMMKFQLLEIVVDTTTREDSLYEDG